MPDTVPSGRMASVVLREQLAADFRAGQTPHVDDLAAALDLPASEFPELAARVITETTRYLTELDSRPIRPGSSGAQTLALFGGPPPAQGLGAAAFDDLRAVIEHSRAGNGRFLGYVMGSGEPVAALGDLF